MLKKLIAYDFKKTSPAMLAIIALLFVPEIIGLIIHAIMEKLYYANSVKVDANTIQVNSDNLPDLYYSLSNMSIVFFLILPAIATIAAIYMIKYYHKTLYSAQGYLSFTLPSSITEVVSSKMIVVFAWAVIYVISATTIIFIGEAIITVVFDPVHGPITLSAVTELLEALIPLLLLLFLGLFSQLMALFFSMSIGHLCKKHKTGITALTYTGIAIASLIIINYNTAACVAKRGTWWWDISDLFCPANLIFLFILLAGCYFATIKIMNKKLNLE